MMQDVYLTIYLFDAQVFSIEFYSENSEILKQHQDKSIIFNQSFI